MLLEWMTWQAIVFTGHTCFYFATKWNDRDVKEIIGTINTKPHTHTRSITDLMKATIDQVINVRA